MRRSSETTRRVSTSGYVPSLVEQFAAVEQCNRRLEERQSQTCQEHALALEKRDKRLLLLEQKLLDAHDTRAPSRLPPGRPVPRPGIKTETGEEAYPNSTVDECKARCNAYGDGCKGFEFGIYNVSYVGDEPAHEPRDCRLQSSAVTTGCDAVYNNLDFYEKVFPPPQPPPQPPTAPPLPPAWPPLPATANELRIAGRHTAMSFNTNVDGIEPFRCVGVGDTKLTCSGELLAADFRTASGISLEELAQFTGVVE